jgi:hypothetical protein
VAERFNNKNMCFHSKQTKIALEVENRFKATKEKKELFKPFNDITRFDFGIHPIITDENPNVIRQFNWGLFPPWSPKIYFIRFYKFFVQYLFNI